MTTNIGRKAETAARVYLEMRGFKIIEQNWRRPYCEIDLIVKKDDIIQLVEVKYRRSGEQGSGMDAITPSKLRHMRRAAAGWAEETRWRGEYILSAIELGGDDFTVFSFVENVF